MLPLFYRFPRTVVRIFTGQNVWGHVAAIVLTFLLVTSGFDGWYFIHLHASALASRLFLAVRLGTVVPVIVPLALLAAGFILRKFVLTNAGWALGQAALLGWIVSSFYKMFTGRPGPRFRSHGVIPDISHVFRFGFWRGGIFWGWPSSHTTVAFAMAFALFFLFRGNRWIRWLAPLYALFVGIGVSMSIHWFSDCVAGGIIGFLIGAAVAASFSERTAPAGSRLR
jgi:membrane-associated phospholipid phosphatase